MQTWNEAVRRYQATHASRAPMTLVRENQLLRWMAPYLDGKPLDTITRGRVEDIRGHAIAMGWGVTSRNHALGTIRQVLRAAADWEWILAAPRVRLEKPAEGRLRWLTLDEARRLVEACPTWLASMVRVALATGLRKATLRQLEWSWINFETATLSVPKSKMKARRALTVPLSDAAVVALRGRVGLHPVYVFNHGDRPIHDPSCRSFRNALKAAGITDFVWHDLRHTWASWHVQNGTPLAELQTLGGWQTLAMVVRYAHLDDGTLRKAAARLPNV